MKNSLTVSIVNFNTGDYLLRCLQSLEKVKDEVEMDIYVVDNSSSDDSFQNAKQKYPKINSVENTQNLGFGKGHNLVLKNLKTEYVLILNPDTEVPRGTLPKMLDFLKTNQDVGAASCKVVLDSGQIDLASHRGFPTPIASLLYFLGNDSLYHLTNRSMDSSHEVDAIAGSFFLTRKSVLQKVGLFDEDFFLYGEDLDLCFRIKQAGFKIIYIPTVSILHHKGVSSGLKEHSKEITTANLETRKRSLYAFYQAMQTFYKKHYEKKYPFFMKWLVYLGINIKWWLAKRMLTV